MQKVSEREKRVHISFDDVIMIFADLTKNEKDYHSIWDNRTLKLLKNLHDLYGTVFSLYVYYANKDFVLSSMTDKFKEQFEMCAGWLEFGFHSYCDEREYGDQNSNLLKEDMRIVEKELIRIMGRRMITTKVRLHRFAASQNSIHAASEYISELLTADDDRLSYELTKEQCDIINKRGSYYQMENDILYTRTDMRLENNEEGSLYFFDKLVNIEHKDCIEVFTHETYLDNPEIVERLERICQYIYRNENCICTF